MFVSTFDYVAERMETFGREIISSPTTRDAAERRTSKRVSVSLEAEREGLSGKSSARVSDLSYHGCYIESYGQTTLGEILKFRLKTPTGRWLQISGEVAHHQPMIGFGLRFTEVSREDQAMLLQLIEFYD